MRESHDIRVPSELLGADLTFGQKMVWIAIRSRQGHNGSCYASQRTLADDLGIDTATVNRAIKVLKERGWIEGHRDLICAIPGVRKKSTTLALDQQENDATTFAKSQLVYAKSQRSVRKKSTRTENQKLKPKQKTKISRARVAESIYAEYPKKVGKVAALKAIEKALQTCDAEHLTERTRAFAKSPAGNAGRYTPNPATWYNQGRYDDDPAAWERTEDGKDPPANGKGYMTADEYYEYKKRKGDDQKKRTDNPLDALVR